MGGNENVCEVCLQHCRTQNRLAAASHPAEWMQILEDVSEVGSVVKVERCEDYDLWDAFVREKKKVLKKWSQRPIDSTAACPTWRIGEDCCENTSNQHHTWISQDVSERLWLQMSPVRAKS